MTIKHKLIPIHQQQEWETALMQVPHTFAHTHWYNQAMSIASKRDVYLYVGESDDFRVLCPLSPRRKATDDPDDITTPYGFSGFATTGSCLQFRQAWQSFLSENNYVCGHIALHPLFEPDFLRDSNDIYEGKNAYYINLSEPIESIREKFSSDHKQRLNKWLKSDYQIVISKDDRQRERFIALYAAFLQTKNAAGVYDFGREAWHHLLNSTHTHLISIINDNTLVAASVFIQYDNMLDYFLSAFTPDGRDHARGIIWEGIKLGKKHNLAWLHLGCGVKPNDSLEEFKKRFGGKAVVTKALKQIYRDDLYQQLCKKYQASPNDIHGYFPPYWR